VVGNVARTPRPRTGLQAGLDTRWNEAREKVLQEIPPGHPYRQAANLMKGEIEIDQMEDAISKYHAENAPRPPDPAFERLSRKAFEWRQRYHRTWMAVREIQQQLGRTVDGWRHVLLGDLPANAMTIPEQASSEPPELRTFTEARAAEQEWEAKTLQLEAFYTALRGVREFDTSPKEIQNSLLLEALFKRVAALEARSPMKEGRKP
jgi:hypothetical protein